MKCFTHSVSSKRKRHSQRSDFICTLRFLAGLKRSVTANPIMPMTILEKSRQVSNATMSRAINSDLHLTNYVQGRCHFISDDQKKLWLTRCKSLLSWLKSHPNVVKTYGEKCFFTVNQAYNHQNDYYVRSEPSPICHGHKEAGQSYGSWCHHQRQQGGQLRGEVTAALYQDDLKTVVIPWIGTQEQL